MVKKVESLFLVIEATAEEFQQIGFGCNGNIETETLTSGLFSGFQQITLEGGGDIVCDNCNADIMPDDTCYYVAVMNRILCKKCYEDWARHAKHYSEDDAFELRNYNRVMSQFEEKRLAPFGTFMVS